MKNFYQLLTDSYVTDNRSEYEKAQEHAHILKAQEHQVKSSIHDVRARRLADAKKKKTPEYKMHVELSDAHHKALQHHVSAHLRYSRERVRELNFHKKRSENPALGSESRDYSKRVVDRLTAEHKTHIKNAKEASEHADALSKSHGQDYSAYEHSWKKIWD